MGRGYMLLSVGVLTALAFMAAPRVGAQARTRAQRASLAERVHALGMEHPAHRHLRHLLTVSDRADPRAWLARTERYLREVEAGRDPYVTAARGQITLRSYRSPLSQRVQHYAVYIPRDYDPGRRYPLFLALHGGSSNGNLFLAQNLGVNVPLAQYRENWDRVHQPTRNPSWIVVAPDGFGNSFWRWAGEADALHVLDDVLAHYAVDPDRVVLGGLSNGGMGSFNIGMRHAHRFAAVVPMAGAPGWTRYLGSRLSAHERRMMEPLSAWYLIENAHNTALQAHHGRLDHGRMQPAFVEALERRARDLSVPFSLRWYGVGHDLVGPVHRQDRVFGEAARARRSSRPREVSVVTGDFRAARQHWVEVRRINNYPSIARIVARATGRSVEVETRNVRAFRLYLNDAPLSRGTGPVRVRIDGQTIPLRSTTPTLWRTGSGWQSQRPNAGGLEKRPGLSGPLPDAYYDEIVHVYGTRRPEHVSALRTAAERGARGFTDTLITLRQRVIPDSDLTAAIAARAHLALYGSPGDNSVLDALADRLPIRATDQGIQIGSRLHRGHLAGRFIYPSPLHPERYLIVQTATDAAGVLAADGLPAFLPDFAFYRSRDLGERRNVSGPRARPVVDGYFDDRWTLPPRGSTD